MKLLTPGKVLLIAMCLGSGLCVIYARLGNELALRLQPAVLAAVVLTCWASLYFAHWGLWGEVLGTQIVDVAGAPGIGLVCFGLPNGVALERAGGKDLPPITWVLTAEQLTEEASRVRELSQQGHQFALHLERRFFQLTPLSVLRNQLQAGQRAMGEAELCLVCVPRGLDLPRSVRAAELEGLVPVAWQQLGAGPKAWPKRLRGGSLLRLGCGEGQFVAGVQAARKRAAEAQIVWVDLATLMDAAAEE